MKPSVLLIYGTTNVHLGLWENLKTDSRVILRTTEIRSASRLNKFFLKLFSYFDRHTGRTLKHLLYNYNDLYGIVPNVQHLIIIDGALKVLNVKELTNCKTINPSLLVHLYLLNSMDAHSPLMQTIRHKIGMYDWDYIYTFDPQDAIKYSYQYVGFNYYSSHPSILLQQNEIHPSDVFFVGGLKGGRTNLINELYRYFVSNGVTSDFYLMTYGKEEVEQLPGVFYYQGWRPYTDILKHVQQTKCIIEIVQDGQYGATLRYFEAVCMNKKLISNNPEIVNFPFYNPRWMRYFENTNDIDIEWIQRDEKVDYNYRGEFSPKHLIDYILNNKNEKV